MENTGFEYLLDIPREFPEFLSVAGSVNPRSLTNCIGKTVHHLTSHMVGSYEEASRHIEAYSQGKPLTRMRSHDEREARLKTKDPAELFDLLVSYEKTMRTLLYHTVITDPDAELLWANRKVKLLGFHNHLRMECALHRWDIVGDDDVSMDILGSDWILQHSVEFVGARPLTARGRAVANEPSKNVSARIRSHLAQDIVITSNTEEARLYLEHKSGTPSIIGDAAACLLLLWGRKPQPFSRLEVIEGEENLERIQMLFSGY